MLFQENYNVQKITTGDSSAAILVWKTLLFQQNDKITVSKLPSFNHCDAQDVIQNSNAIKSYY